MSAVISLASGRRRVAAPIASGLARRSLMRGLLAWPLLVVLAGSAQAAARSHWSARRIPPPAHATSASVNGVSCTSPVACTAVGAFSRDGGVFSLIERWNGSSWSVQASPKSAVPLTGVSCASSTACTAVGYTYDQGSAHSVIEHWNGSTWSIQPSPKPPIYKNNSKLVAVSCPADNACTAVGSYGDPSGDLPSFPLVERWKGRRWQIQNSPTPTPHVNSGAYIELLGVSCASRSACIAVGDSIDLAEDVYPRIERWNGRRWSTASPPDWFGNLFGVSCSAANACTAVGFIDNNDGAATMARWNGTLWSPQNPVTTTDRYAIPDYQAVSCASRTTCVAVGPGFGSGGGRTFVDRWNGLSWATEPFPPNAWQGQLDSVSCPTRKYCVIVGNPGASEDHPTALILSRF